MKRTIVGTLVVCMALGGLTLVAGCGDDERRTRARIPESRLKAQKTLKDMTPEERAALHERQLEVVKQVFMWPEGKGESRDVLADNKECVEALEARRDLANANPLIQMTWGARCMAEKGWVLNPDVEINKR